MTERILYTASLAFRAVQQWLEQSERQRRENELEQQSLFRPEPLRALPGRPLRLAPVIEISRR